MQVDTIGAGQKAGMAKGTNMATIDTIKKLLEENLDVDPSTVTEDSTLESLDLDSLDMVELISDLEEEEGIDFGEPEGITTVGDIVKHVDSLK